MSATSPRRPNRRRAHRVPLPTSALPVRRRARRYPKPPSRRPPSRTSPVGPQLLSAFAKVSTSPSSASSESSSRTGPEGVLKASEPWLAIALATRSAFRTPIEASASRSALTNSAPPSSPKCCDFPARESAMCAATAAGSGGSTRTRSTRTSRIPASTSIASSASNLGWRASSRYKAAASPRKTNAKLSGSSRGTARRPPRVYGMTRPSERALQIAPVAIVPCARNGGLTLVESEVEAAVVEQPLQFPGALLCAVKSRVHRTASFIPA